MIDFLGYVSTLFVLLSFLSKNMKNLRELSCIGSFGFIIYGILLNWNIPILITNTIIFAINIYKLNKGEDTK